MAEYTFVRPNRKVERIFLHCTAYSHGDLLGQRLLDAVNNWHKQRGWDKVGYHFLIDREGTLIPTYRSLEENPIAQAGHNSRTIAICLDGLYADQFTEAQFVTLNALADQIDTAYKHKVTWHGHCEVSQKSCPVFDYRKVLGLGRQGYRFEPQDFSNDLAVRFEKHEVTFDYTPGQRTLRMTSRGQDVAWLQNKLGLKPDGVFGQDTKAAVVKFQQENSLIPDGVVGGHTWRVAFEKLGRE